MSSFSLNFSACRISKLHWIRLNRGLAWMLMLSPLMQLFLGISFWRSLSFDFGLLIAHGLLSLALFGKPHSAAYRAQSWFSRAVGGQRHLLHGRERFLLDAWRIVMSLSVLWLFGSSIFQGISALFASNRVWLIILLMFGVLYFPFLLGISVLRHVRDASSYAYRRWHIPAEQAKLWGERTLIAFIVISTLNLFK